MITPRRGLAVVLPVLVLTVGGLSGCDKSADGAGGGLSLGDKAKTVQTCVDVATAAQKAAEVGAKVAQGALSQADAAAQLQPIATHLMSLAEQDAGLPIGKGLRKLSDSITALQKASPKVPADLQAAGQSLASETKSVLAECADIGK